MKNQKNTRENPRGFFSPKKGVLLEIEKGVILCGESAYFQTNVSALNFTKCCVWGSNKYTLGKTPSEAPFYAGKKW